MNAALHRLYGEKIILWRNLAGRWDRQECEYRELKEAQAAMEVVWAILVGQEKRSGPLHSSVTLVSDDQGVGTMTGASSDGSLKSVPTRVRTR